MISNNECEGEEQPGTQQGRSQGVLQCVLLWEEDEVQLHKDVVYWVENML